MISLPFLPEQPHGRSISLGLTEDVGENLIWMLMSLGLRSDSGRNRQQLKEKDPWEKKLHTESN